MIELTKRISFEVEISQDLADLIFSNPLFVSDNCIRNAYSRSVATSDRSETAPQLSSHKNLSSSRQTETSVMNWFKEKGIQAGHPD